MEELLERGLTNNAFPGVVLLAGTQESNLIQIARGWAEIEPEKRVMSTETKFDLASLTKVIVTTPLALFLLEQGELRLDDFAGRFREEFRHKEVTIRHLLTHTSGLPAHQLFTNICDPLENLWELELENEPGQVVNYSCMGFILLGKIIEEITGKTLAENAHEIIFGPLGMAKTEFNPEEGPFAATELGNEFEQKKGAQPREGIMRGVVHDGNAYSLGGIAGNAGLFGPAGDIARFARMILAEGEGILAPSTVEMMFTLQTPPDQERRSPGWCLPGPYSSGGDLLSKRAIGHTGFTGTSLWIDLEKKKFVVLLTNRVHPKVSSTEHIRMRPLIHNRAWAEMEKKGLNSNF